MSGRISDDPEGFFARFLRNLADDIEEGIYSAEGLTQSFGDDFVVTVTLKPTFEAAP